MANMKKIYRDKQHKEFYIHYLNKCRCQDTYHMALIYCLGIDEDVRKHIDDIYDFMTDCINTECLHEGWQTSSSMRTIRLAINLYTDAVASVYDYDNQDRQLGESKCYSVSEIMCCDYLRYFIEAIKIRYSKYL